MPLDPVALDEILRSDLWNDFIFRDSEIMWQASLMEPVGGMDHFVKAFARQSLTRQTGTIGGLVRFGARVTAIDVGDDRVQIIYEDSGVHARCSPPTTASRPSRCRCSRTSRPICRRTT